MIWFLGKIGIKYQIHKKNFNECIQINVREEKTN